MVVWYSYSCFLYSLLNRALRLMDTGIIIRTGFFIGDLHRCIQQLHKEQYGGRKSVESFTVCRDQGILKSEFEQMRKKQGWTHCIQQFFIHHKKNRDVSVVVAESNANDPNFVGIPFVMTIDSVQSTTPFACIADVGYFEVENEVLFSMHTLFRVRGITPINENDQHLR